MRLPQKWGGHILSSEKTEHILIYRKHIRSSEKREHILIYRKHILSYRPSSLSHTLSLTHTHSLTRAHTQTRSRSRTRSPFPSPSPSPSLSTWWQPVAHGLLERRHMQGLGTRGPSLPNESVLRVIICSIYCIECSAFIEYRVLKPLTQNPVQYTHCLQSTLPNASFVTWHDHFSRFRLEGVGFRV